MRLQESNGRDIYRAKQEEMIRALKGSRRGKSIQGRGNFLPAYRPVCSRGHLEFKIQHGCCADDKEASESRADPGGTQASMLTNRWSVCVCVWSVLSSSQSLLEVNLRLTTCSMSILPPLEPTGKCVRRKWSLKVILLKWWKYFYEPTE